MHTQLHDFFNRLRMAGKNARLGIVSLRLFALLLLLALPPVCFGQGATATLTGNVTDPQGAVVPGATVTVTSSAIGIKRQTTTDGEGNYT
ncbi:MAG: carboxypeptidase-like regulatory domain-containing protein, partial [Acidobacteria bacterium]|nr:carboxypeptidase-like regulatory domain-containing protein [Acidobacteriota bacterium]